MLDQGKFKKKFFTFNIKKKIKLYFLRITKSLYDIFISSEGSLLSSIGVLLGNLQKDTQYRIREKIYETLGKLGVFFVRIFLILKKGTRSI